MHKQIMSYYFNKQLSISFEEATKSVIGSLQKEGFGIISEIDIQAKMKEKLDKDMKKYTILGACNPSIAYEALQHENKLGTMLPCNFIVQEIEKDQTEVSAIDPLASMQAVKNPALESIATEVREKLKSIIEGL